MVDVGEQMHPGARAVALAGERIHEAVEVFESEIRAVRTALPIGRQGVRNFRKWLGWASYRFAAWVNPEVRERW